MKSRSLITVIGILGHTFVSIAELPSIFRQPSSQVVLLGSVASFEVGATGSEPLAYQWQANGTNIPHATNATLSIQTGTTPVPLLISVAMTNSVGAVLSRQVSLTMLTYTRRTNPGVMFTIWGPELIRYGLQSTAELSASNTWQTVRTGAVPLNINTATFEALIQVPGIDDNIAQAIIQRRAGPDGIEGTNDDTPFRSQSEIAIWIGLVSESLLTTRQPPALGLGIGSPPGPPRPGTPATNLPTQFLRIVLLDDVP